MSYSADEIETMRGEGVEGVEITGDASDYLLPAAGVAALAAGGGYAALKISQAIWIKKVEQGDSKGSAEDYQRSLAADLVANRWAAIQVAKALQKRAQGGNMASQMALMNVMQTGMQMEMDKQMGQMGPSMGPAMASPYARQSGARRRAALLMARSRQRRMESEPAEAPDDIDRALDDSVSGLTLRPQTKKFIARQNARNAYFYAVLGEPDDWNKYVARAQAGDEIAIDAYNWVADGLEKGAVGQAVTVDFHGKKIRLTKQSDGNFATEEVPQISGGDEHDVAGFGKGIDLCGWLFK